MHVRVPKLGNTFWVINALMDYTINKYKNGQLEWEVLLDFCESKL